MIEQDPRRRRRRSAAMRKAEAEWAARSGPVKVIPSVIARAEQLESARPSTHKQAREIERLRKSLGLPLEEPIPKTFVGAQALVKRLFAQESESKRKVKRRRPLPARSWTLDLAPIWVERNGSWVVETHPENTPTDLSKPVEVVARDGRVTRVWLRGRCGVGDVGTLWRFTKTPPRKVARAA